VVLIGEPLLSIVGGGLVAAVLPLGFNAWLDCRKQRLAEDWEFKKYHANMLHNATAGIMEAYFSAKNEMYYLTSKLESLLSSLNQLSAQADQIVRQQGGQEFSVAQLEQRKRQLLQPFQTYNQQQVQLRWNNYEQKAMENHTKAEPHLITLKPLIPKALHDELTALFVRLSAPFYRDLPNGK